MQFDHCESTLGRSARALTNKWQSGSLDSVDGTWMCTKHAFERGMEKLLQRIRTAHMRRWIFDEYRVLLTAICAKSSFPFVRVFPVLFRETRSESFPERDLRMCRGPFSDTLRERHRTFESSLTVPRGRKREWSREMCKGTHENVLGTSVDIAPDVHKALEDPRSVFYDTRIYSSRTKRFYRIWILFFHV